MVHAYDPSCKQTRISLISQGCFVQIQVQVQTDRVVLHKKVNVNMHFILYFFLYSLLSEKYKICFI